MTFPSGLFTPDPNSLATYDAPFHRWLPVREQSLSPDGSRYAYVVNTPQPIVHIITVATGTDSPIGVPTPVAILSFEADAIYLTQVILNSDAPGHGIVALNPDTADWHLITHPNSVDDTSYTTVRGGYAYSGSAALGADTIPTDGPPPYWNELYKTQLAMLGQGFGGLIYERDSQLRFIGIDGGAQAVVSAESNTSYSIYTAGSLAYQAGPPQFKGSPGDPNNPKRSALGDGTAIWFGSDSGLIWYYSGNGAAFEAVAQTPVHGTVIAGPCT